MGKVEPPVTVQILNLIQQIVISLPTNSMSSATSNIHLKFLVLKENGGPNFKLVGKFFTEDGDIDEYGTLALGFPIAAAIQLI